MATVVLAGLASAIGVAAASLSLFGLGAVGSFFAAFAIGSGLSLVSRALAPKLDLGTQMGGRSVMTREAAQSRKIVYGRARIGGNIVYLESTGDDNKYLYLVIAVAGHEIDAYEEVWFNDEKIYNGSSFIDGWASFVNISFYKGDQTAADSGLVSASATNNGKWTNDHKLLDTAYMVVRLEHDVDKFAQGLPNISTVIRGKKVLDPSNNSTAWSQNPALCIYDYLRDTKYGLGESAANILTSSVTTAKGVCDEDVSLAAGGTQPRYTIDGVVDTASSIKSNMETMTGSMIGRLIYSGGKFEIHAGEYVAPTITIDESMAVGEISVQTKQSRRNAFNGVKGVFVSEDDNYIVADYPAQQSKTTAGNFEVTSPPSVRYKILEIGSTNFTLIGASSNTVGLDFTATGAGTGDGVASLFLAQDGEPIYLDMPLPFTINNIRAQRIAKLALLRSRQQEAITIPCNLTALKFKIGDNISVTNTRLGYSGKVFEVVGYSMGFNADQMVVNVEAIETAASIWNWQTSDEEVFLGGGEVDLYDGKVAQPPRNLSVSGDSFLAADGTFSTAFNVSFTDANDAFTDHYVVEHKLASASSYFSQATKNSPFTIIGLQNGQQYNIRVKAVNELNVSSAYVSATPTAATDTTPPGVPTNPLAKGEYRQIQVSWTNPTQKDLKLVEVFRAETVGGTYNYVGNGDTSFIDTDLDTPREYFYKIRSCDFTFNKSAFTAIISATSKNVNITAPDNPDIVIYDGESGIPPSVTSGRTTLDTNTGTFYLKQDYKEHIKFHLTYPVGALTSGTVAGETNAINSTMAAFKFQVFYAPIADPTNFTQFGADISSVRKTTASSLISNYLVKTTNLGSGNFKAELQTRSQVQAANPTLSGFSLGIIDDNYNLTETIVVYDFPAGEYVFKVSVTITDGSASSYPSTGSPANNLKRFVDAIGFQMVNKSGYTYALEPSYQPITIFRDDNSNEIVRLSEGADTLELSAINSSGVPVQAFVGGGASSTTTWGARIQFDDDLATYSNGGIGQYQIGIDKSGTHLSLGTAPGGGGYPRGLNPSLSELRISSGRTDIQGTLFLNGTQISATSVTGMTEVYPLAQYYNVTLTTSDATLGSFSLPAPESSISKRQKVNVSILCEIQNANQTAQALSAINLTVQKKSKGVNAVTVGTLTVEGTPHTNMQLVSVSGNQLEKVDRGGGVAASNNASNSNEPGTINSVYFDTSANKTYLLVGASSAILSTGNTLFYSDSKFTSSGTWLSPSGTEVVNSTTPPDPDANYVNATAVSTGTGKTRFYIPFQMTYGKTTTATDYRVRANVSIIPTGITYKIIKIFGTLENVK